MTERHASERVWTLEFLDAVIRGAPEAAHIHPRVAAYVRQISELHDRQTTLRLAHEHLFGVVSPSARHIEIEPGRRVPYCWDRHVVEPYAKRKLRQVAERDLRELQQAGLAHG